MSCSNHFVKTAMFSDFRTKLNYNPPKDDGSTYKIELEGISVDIMKEILDYIFSGQVCVSKVIPTYLCMSVLVIIYTFKKPFE